MSEKSHVGMGYCVCPVCGDKHDEVVLLNKRMKPTVAPENFMGYIMCDTHRKLKEEGYIACIEIKGTQPKGFADANRTGKLMHIKNQAWSELFNQPIPEKGICFVEEGVIDNIEANLRMEDK